MNYLGVFLPNLIKLDRNEIPYPPPPNVLGAAKRALEEVNRYQEEEELDELRDLAARYMGVEEDLVVLSPGSEVLVELLLREFGERVVVVKPSFFHVVEMTRFLSGEVCEVELSPPLFELDREKLFVYAQKASAVYVDVPNNPIGGVLLSEDDVVRLAKACRGVVIVDEAYYEFCGTSFAHLVHSLRNLVVARTMSKAFALAGMRVGCAASGELALSFLEELWLEWLISTPSLRAAKEALRNPSYAFEIASRISEERKRVSSRLRGIGLEVHEGPTNFVMVKGKPSTPNELRNKGILVFDLSEMIAPGYFRAAISTEEQNNVFLSALEEILING